MLTEGKALGVLFLGFSVCLKTSADFSVAFFSHSRVLLSVCNFKWILQLQKHLFLSTIPLSTLQAWDQCSVFCMIMRLISEKYTLFFWYSWACVTWNMLLFLLALLHIPECASTWEADFFKSFEICKTQDEYFCSWFSEIQFWKCLAQCF